MATVTIQYHPGRRKRTRKQADVRPRRSRDDSRPHAGRLEPVDPTSLQGPHRRNKPQALISPRLLNAAPRRPADMPKGLYQPE
eukprot:3410588-Pyramimonas_sp.AAC.1